jgi:quercetin dioxygenase-like cupin family protein
LAAASGAAQQKALPSKAFKYEDLPVSVNGQNKTRAVMSGETHSGFPFDLHMTELGPGQAPHEPHKHVHEELLMLQSGVLDATITGQTTRVTAGSVVYLASNDLHGWRNPGPGTAQYFVLALGRETP